MIQRKTGDTRPEEAILIANGRAVDLTNATVKFAAALVPPSDAVPIQADAVVVQALVDGKIKDRGRVRWDPTPEQVATPGVFLTEWEVTWADDTVETFPDGGYEHMELLADLA